MGLSEFKACLFYEVSSRTVEAVTQKKIKKKTKKSYQDKVKLTLP